MSVKKVTKPYQVVKNGIEFKSKRKGKVIISEEEVRMLSRLHCPLSDIARYFDVPKETLYGHFKVMIDEEKERTKQKLRAKQLDEAYNGNTTLLIWLGKQMLGQTDQGPKDDDDKLPLPWKDD
jgi:hypothetical protein